ncbi:MAG: DUF2264 domain-containing protein [Aliivibrio sp.]|uniref:DUF2264 domain-containing protein n=1 Tax=Aliivibrio sp. TaxID=1872443 RepID=UPI001A3A1787|nr:DUF2264 domain-containing protein [Aliivibrio sp.]
MSVEMKETIRPKIAYEHPTRQMYMKLFKENVIRHIHKRPKFTCNDEEIKRTFANEDISLKEKCLQLTRYIAEAFEYYSTWDYTHAFYPGKPSQQGARVDAMEGVSRVLPTLAIWLNSVNGDSKKLKSIDNRAIDIKRILSSSFLSGTDPSHKGYWGEMHDCDQRICESADLALALWISKKWVWSSFSTDERVRIINWFKQVNNCVTVDNNWHLFILTVQFVVKDLSGEDNICREKYARIKEFYVGEGWFRDGAEGNYDYYNAWGFHYSLYWLDKIDPKFDSSFIHNAASEYTNKYRYFFTAEGFPFFGRSACYRLAASAPLLAAADYGGDSVSIGEAKRAFRVSMEYFIVNGALKNGAPTQGLFDDDARLIDNYSGPASCLWSLRALNIALYCGDSIDLWQATEELLQIEKSDFEFDITAINAKIIGVFETKEVVCIFKDDYTKNQNPHLRQLEKQSLGSKCRERLTGRAERPKNNLLRKGITCYSSKLDNFF